MLDVTDFLWSVVNMLLWIAYLLSHNYARLDYCFIYCHHLGLSYPGWWGSFGLPSKSDLRGRSRFKFGLWTLASILFRIDATQSSLLLMRILPWFYSCTISYNWHQQWLCETMLIYKAWEISSNKSEWTLKAALLDKLTNLKCQSKKIQCDCWWTLRRGLKFSD